MSSPQLSRSDVVAIADPTSRAAALPLPQPLVSQTVNSDKTAHILLVEDSDDDVFFFRRALRRCHLSAVVMVVSSGMQAQAFLQGQGEFSHRGKWPLPELIVLDWRTWPFNGADMLEWLSAQPDLQRQIPVVILTGEDLRQVEPTAFKLGAKACLSKPLDDRAVERIRQLLDGAD